MSKCIFRVWPLPLKLLVCCSQYWSRLKSRVIVQRADRNINWNNQNHSVYRHMNRSNYWNHSGLSDNWLTPSDGCCCHGDWESANLVMKYFLICHETLLIPDGATGMLLQLLYWWLIANAQKIQSSIMAHRLCEVQNAPQKTILKWYFLMHISSTL